VSTGERSPADAAVRGRLLIISAPSGAGKSTLIREVLRRFPGLAFSISHTTRTPRRGETDGVEYHFTTREEFERGIDEGRWAEWARVHGNYYGSCSRQLEDHLRHGRWVLLDIDVQGMEQLRRRYPDSVTIFILPPSEAELRRRLLARGTEDAQTVARRLAAGREEMTCQDRFDYRVVNDRISTAVARLCDIVTQVMPAGEEEARGKRHEPA
jgi:guanylate kinase